RGPMTTKVGAVLYNKIKVLLSLKPSIGKYVAPVVLKESTVWPSKQSELGTMLDTSTCTWYARTYEDKSGSRFVQQNQSVTFLKAIDWQICGASRSKGVDCMAIQTVGTWYHVGYQHLYMVCEDL